MAYMENTCCFNCGKPIQVIKGMKSQHKLDLCSDCSEAEHKKKQDKAEVEWQKHLAELKELSLEKRLERVERWIWASGFHFL